MNPKGCFNIRRMKHLSVFTMSCVRAIFALLFEAFVGIIVAYDIRQCFFIPFQGVRVLVNPIPRFEYASKSCFKLPVCFNILSEGSSVIRNRSSGCSYVAK